MDMQYNNSPRFCPHPPMTIEVCKDNPMIDEDIQLFSQALSQDGEIIGERLTVLSRLLKEAGY